MKKKNKFLIIEKAAICALCFCISLSITAFSAECQDIRSQVLRLHVLANSDTPQDQSLKLQVRDCVLKESGAFLTEADNKAEAASFTKAHLRLLEKAANRCVYEAGYDYPIKVSLEKTYFPTKSYENVTLPAGMYDAVRVEIGAAKGHNWWCVIFPAICLPAAQDSLDRVLTENEMKLVEQQNGYKLRFKSAELWEELQNWLKSRKE